MEGISIFNSVTLIRGVEPDAVMEIISGFRKRDKYPFKFSKKRIPNLQTALKHLKPLVKHSTNRYLFCCGKNDSWSAYSNFVFGSAANLTGPTVARYDADVMAAYWNDYELARSFDSRNIPSDPKFHCNLEVRLKTQNDRRRTFGCTMRGNGDLYDCWDGDLFPFEKPQDYTHLKDGAVPGMHVLEGFCGLFGWPPLTSPNYPDFIKYCILYEFPASSHYPEPTVNQDLQAQALRWPWKKKTILKMFVEGLWKG